MEKEKKEEREEKTASNPSFFKLDLRSKLIFVLILIAVVALGLLAVNQFLAYRFKAQFLGSPCQLCEELNPEVTKFVLEGSEIEVDINKVKIKNVLRVPIFS